jgi:hypothetical protein
MIATKTVNNVFVLEYKKTGQKIKRSLGQYISITLGTIHWLKFWTEATPKSVY